MSLTVNTNTNIANNLEKFKNCKLYNSENKTFTDKNFETSAKASKSKCNMANIAGLLTGLTAPAYLIYDTFHKVSEEEAKELAKSLNNFISEVDTFENTQNTALKILEETGLKSKGVRINYIDEAVNNKSFVNNIFTEKSINSFVGTRLKENYYNIFKEGANAAYVPTSNQIITSHKGLHSLIYHEIGHALNANGNFFTKSLQKMRIISPFGISLIAPIALCAGIFHKPDKAKPNSQKNITEKSMDFISKHPAGLTFAGYIPMLAEEGLASIRGLKYASKHLDSSKINKLSGNYLKAWSTYAAYSAIVSTGVWLGVTLSDKLKKTDAQKMNI